MRKWPEEKSLGLKRWRLLGAFGQGLPISDPFCASFSFPLPYRILHLTLPLCVQTSHMPKAPFHSICRYSFSYSILPISTPISLLPAIGTTPSDQKRPYTFLTLRCSTSSRVNEISTTQTVTEWQVSIDPKTSKRICGFRASIFCGSHSLLVRSRSAFTNQSRFTFKSQPIITRRRPIDSGWWCNDVFSGARLGTRPKAKLPFVQF